MEYGCSNMFTTHFSITQTNMEATFSTCKLSPAFAPPLISQPGSYSLVTKLFHIPENSKGYKNPKLGQHGQQHGCRLVMGCAKREGISLAETEAKIKSEQNSDFDVEEKCQGKSGVVELMECLECEAIMGEDQGKEAGDYNRRAQIFDKSAQVFQALKEETKECPTDT